jgi:hypothetical protein
MAVPVKRCSVGVECGEVGQTVMQVKYGNGSRSEDRARSFRNTKAQVISKLRPR